MIALMKSFLAVLALAATSLAGEKELKSALLLHASFDSGVKADFAKGDAEFYSAKSMKAPTWSAGLPASGYVSRVEQGGKLGGWLRFEKRTDEMVFFQAPKNVNYSSGKMQGSVSLWLNLTPDVDLEPGYTDPIQITSKAWNDAAFFVEFTKDEKPRHFRLGAYADYKVWNPTDRKWEEMPFEEKPLVKVENPPFKRGTWTHVVFTFSNYNTGKKDGVTDLYLNGKRVGGLTPREQTFTWDLEKTKIMLGLSYVGGFDELSVFDRALTAAEVEELHQLKRGVTGLLR